MIRVVLADDQTLIRQGIRGLLQLTTEVQVVAEAEDGDAALAQIKEHRPDIGLLDVRMPGKTGVEFTRALRQLGDKTPIILLTSFDDDTMLLEGVRAGISGYLLKDVGVQQLVGALRAVASGQTLILPGVSDRAQRYFADREVEFEAAELPDALTAARGRGLTAHRRRATVTAKLPMPWAAQEGTVKNQASSILSKLGVRDRTRAVLLALKMGWLF